MALLIVTDIQLKFLEHACNLKEAVLNFDLTNTEFKKWYGFTKKQAEKHIVNLDNRILFVNKRKTI